MAKKDKTHKTALTIGDYTVALNQTLGGIEVKGKNEDGSVPKKEDEYLRSKGFFFSKRKAHYWVVFNSALYDEVVKHYEAVAKKSAVTKKTKKTEAKTKSLGEILPIDMSTAFKEEPAKKQTKKPAKKSTKKSTTKSTKTKSTKTKSTKTKSTKTESTKVSVPSVAPTTDLEAWKREVIKAVEAMLDSSIEMMVKGEVLA